MSEIRIQFAGGWWRCDGTFHNIGQPLNFEGPQASFFGVEPARARALNAGSFVGDTRQGGSCNVAQVTLVPHCNGTHTESAAHLDPARPKVLECAPRSPLPALLCSIQPDFSEDVDESLPDSASGNDLIIGRRAIETALKAWQEPVKALIIRTLPNERDKVARQWESFPYFTGAAGEFLRERGLRHLLLDTPSFDRSDDPRLSAHRAFFGLATDAPPAATITELCFVPNSLTDGYYLLNLQLAPFVGDAAPSRPLLANLTKANTVDE